MKFVKYLGKKIIILFKNNASFVSLFAIIIIASFVSSSFLTMNNISNVIRQASFNGLIALGMTVVILCGSIDLSVGSLFGLAGYVALLLSNYSIAAAIIAPLLVGLVIGLLNALLINKLDMAPFIATLSTMMAVRGITLALTNEQSYATQTANPAFTFLGKGVIFEYITFPAIIFFILAGVLAYFLKYTKSGRNIYATGGNKEAAKMMGINVNKSIILAHTIASVLTAFSGVMLVSRLGAAHPLAGDGAELKAIAAVVIGGTYLTGGRGKISGTIAGVIFIGLLTNIFNMQNTLSTFWEPVISGLLVLTVVLIQTLHTKQQNKLNRFN